MVITPLYENQYLDDNQIYVENGLQIYRFPVLVTYIIANWVQVELEFWSN